MAASTLVTALALAPLLPLLFLFGLRIVLRLWGWSLHSSTQDRRHLLYTQLQRDLKSLDDKQKTFEEDEDGWEKIEKTGTAANGQKEQGDWDGIVGFFHPFCNAGGGGERVLWAAIAATQQRWPRAICAVYTGDHDIDRAAAVAKVKDRFDIILRAETLQFIYLSTRHFVLANNYPYFTLLGQSLGSLVLACDAFHLLVPDIFIDTMGYAFSLALCKYLFPWVPTAAYVHYPTISTDMLDSLDDTTGTRGIHSGAGAGWKGRLKRTYWHLFARLYGWVGRHVDVVRCNSSWTLAHISQLWKSQSKPEVIYPPCPVDVLSINPLNPQSESQRESIILYIAQFRPEKNHSLVLRSFARYLRSRLTSETSSSQEAPRLVLIGSVRSNTPDERHVYNLRLEARELKIADSTSFITDAPFSLIQSYLSKASISVNAMYCEHFGIGNVEALAAGVIPVVHRSGGPYLDIVVDWEGGMTGFCVDGEEEYAAAFAEVLDMKDMGERLEMRKRGRSCARRFTEEVFAERWVGVMELLVRTCRGWNA